jgi:hypothetical protein
MTWISRAELRRLLQQVAAAEQRAQKAEDALAAERQAKDWMVTQLTSRFVTKQGSYGLDHKPPEPITPHPKQFIREPTEIDLVKLEYYKKCARNAGRDEQGAIDIWEAEMRGETITFQYDDEVNGV